MLQTVLRTGWHWHLQSLWGTSKKRFETWEHLRTIERRKKKKSITSVLHAKLFCNFYLNLRAINFCMSTLYISVLINLVSNIYPRGIQFRNRSKVSKVAWTKGAFWEFSCKQPLVFMILLGMTGEFLKTSLKK